MLKILATLPASLTGLALGIAGLTGALGTVFAPSIAAIGCVITAVLVFSILLRNIVHFPIFIQEFKHPVSGSYIPTLFMASMLVAAYIVPYVRWFGVALWLVAIVGHLAICVNFIYYRIKFFHHDHIVPSWFVPPVGIVVACVTSVDMGFPLLARVLFYVGFGAYCILLPIILYRLFFGTRLTDEQLPTFAIMGAPANLCLAGLLTVFPNASPYVVHALLALGVMTTLLVYLFFIRIIQLSFTPGFASLTFPLAVGATAVLKYTVYAEQVFQNPSIVEFWYTIGMIELIVASCVIAFVALRLFVFILYTNRQHRITP